MRPQRWIYKLPLRIRSLFDRQKADQELDEELRYHVEQKTQQYMAAGMVSQEARRAALLEIGGLEKRKEECRDARQVTWLQDFLQDIHYGLRILRKSPGVTFVVVIALALGVGANTSIFCVVNGSILRPLPVPSPEQITVRAIQQKDAPVGSSGFSYPEFVDFRKQAGTVSNIFGMVLGTVQFTANDQSEACSANYVSGNFFSALGLQPAAGRLYRPSEAETPGEPLLVILGYGYWQKIFHGDPRAVGKQIVINGKSATIIGAARIPGHVFHLRNARLSPHERDDSRRIRKPFLGQSRSPQNPGLRPPPTRNHRQRSAKFPRRNHGAPRPPISRDGQMVHRPRYPGKIRASHRLCQQFLRGGFGPVPGSRRLRPAARLHERGKYPARARLGTPTRNGYSRRSGCRTRAAHPPDAHRKYPARNSRRRRWNAPRNVGQPPDQLDSSAKPPNACGRFFRLARLRFRRRIRSARRFRCRLAPCVSRFCCRREFRPARRRPTRFFRYPSSWLSQFPRRRASGGLIHAAGRCRAFRPQRAKSSSFRSRVRSEPCAQRSDGPPPGRLRRAARRCFLSRARVSCALSPRRAIRQPCFLRANGRLA